MQPENSSVHPRESHGRANGILFSCKKKQAVSEKGDSHMDESQICCVTEPEHTFVFFSETSELEQERQSSRNQVLLEAGLETELSGMVASPACRGSTACLVCICCLIVDPPVYKCAIRQCWLRHVKWKAASLRGPCPLSPVPCPQQLIPVASVKSQKVT